MSLLLIRHGETAWNRQGRYQGRSDPPLTARGREQARLIGAELAAVHAHSIVSSPLRRAHATALDIGRRLSLPVELDGGLSELSFGVWEGLTQAEVKQRWPDALRRWKQRPDAAPPPGGEPLPVAAERIRHCLDGLVASRPAHVIVVTHVGVIRIARLLAMGVPLAEYRRVQVANAEIVRLEWPLPGTADDESAGMAGRRFT
jgi:probable phosphoglycerate mutase